MPDTKAPRLISVPVILDPSLEAAMFSAQSRLNDRAKQLLESFQARVQREQIVTGLDPVDVAQTVTEADEAELNDLRAEYEAAASAVTDAVQTYTFRPLGWKAWRALKKAHPSKDKTLQFDVDSITPDLLHLASHDPQLSKGQVEDLLESADWSEGEINMLVNGAVQAQS
ncbi:MAG: hypothetical protein NVV70_16790 [Cellulomonas sp.]|nr:hypothetical protein [Cellulomonas sp.]MCR6649703.1 hypothetical protein [Cellulomonas sp.]